MKKVLVFALAMFAVGCSPTYDDSTGDYKLPPELSHCKIFNLKTDMNTLKVVYCPNATTSNTYRSGKTTKRVTFVDEGQYGFE